MKGSHYMLLFVLLFSQYFIFQANIGTTHEADHHKYAKRNNVMAFVVIAFILFIASLFSVLFCLSKLNKFVRTRRSMAENQTNSQNEGQQIEMPAVENDTDLTPFQSNLIQAQADINSTSPASLINNRSSLVSDEVSPASQTSATKLHATALQYPYIEEYPITSVDLASLTQSTSGVDISDYIPPDSEASSSTALHFPRHPKKDGSLKRLKQVFYGKIDQQVVRSQNNSSGSSTYVTNQNGQEKENHRLEESLPGKKSHREDGSSHSSSKGNHSKSGNVGKRPVEKK